MTENNKFDTNIELNRQPDRMMNTAAPSAGKTLMIAGIVITAALILGAFIAIAPDVKSQLNVTAEQQERIDKLEQELAVVKSVAPPSMDTPQPTEENNWTSVLPIDVKNKFESVSNDVKTLSTEAQNLKQAVTQLQSGSMPERLAVIEDNMNKFLSVEQQAQLSTMFDRVQMMGQSVTGQQSLDGAMQALIGALQTSPDPDKAISDARAINPDVATALDGVAPEDAKAATMLLAFSQLRGSLQRNKDSFDTDLTLLKQTLAKDNPELQAAIDRLAPQAKTGVLTPQGLSNELRSITGEVVEASLTGKDVSIQDKVMSRLTDVVKVEKNGVPITGNETQLTITNAQKMLDRGDVAGAVAALQTLDGAAAQKTAPLLGQAEATLAAQKLQSLLGTNMVGQLQNTIRQMAQTGTINTGNLQQIVTEVQKMVPQNTQPLGTK
jgi:hypothetical protein